MPFPGVRIAYSETAAPTPPFVLPRGPVASCGPPGAFPRGRLRGPLTPTALRRSSTARQRDRSGPLRSLIARRRTSTGRAFLPLSRWGAAIALSPLLDTSARVGYAGVMNEAEWLASEDPTPMLKYLGSKASNRKLR